jgi:DNA transposition AAA+ family ATPase
MGLKEYSHTACAMHHAICGRLRHTNGLLIIDEAQHLTVNALDQVRSIYDDVKIGIALVGNEHVYGRMTGGTRAAYLDRLFSRIGMRVQLKRASEGDVETFVKAWGVTDRACMQEMRAIASKPGALRVLGKVLGMAAAFAKGAGRDICCEDVRAAWKRIGEQP